MQNLKKYIFTQKGAAEDKLETFTPPLRGMTKYELVLLLAKRAREINQLRIDLQKKYNVHLIEKRKPIMMALDEYLRGELAPLDSFSLEQKEKEAE